MKRLVLPMAIALTTSGCCAIVCNTRPPNSHIKVDSELVAECSFEDKAGIRQFYAPGEVLGMPKNAPGTLTCNAKGYKSFTKTISARDWKPLTVASDDPESMRYFSEIQLTLEPLTK